MEERIKAKHQKNENMHNLILENRKKLSVSGIEEVESFNEEEIILRTCEDGVLVIKGVDLHINKLSVDTGDGNSAGEVSAMDYIDRSPKSKGSGLLSRLLR